MLSLIFIFPNDMPVCNIHGQQKSRAPLICNGLNLTQNLGVQMKFPYCLLLLRGRPQLTSFSREGGEGVKVRCTLFKNVVYGALQF